MTRQAFTPKEPLRRTARPCGNPISFEDVVDRSRVGTFHYLVLALTGAVAFLDGLDTQAISYIAPVLALEWQLPDTTLGPILSAAIAGVVVGYLVLAPLANKIGFRTVLITAVALLGFFTVLCALAQNPAQLIVLRFLTGLGLGASMPTALTLASEFAPHRRRASFVLFVTCCYSLGFVVAGLAAGTILPHLGWRPLFVIAGALPLMLSLVLLARLPESPRLLMRRPDGRHRVLALARRFDPTINSEATVEVHEADTGRGRPLVELVKGRWLVPTILVWVAFVANFGMLFAVQSWMPILVGRTGHDTSVVVAATSLTAIGGILAVFGIAPLMERISPFLVLSTVYIGGAGLTALLGLALGFGVVPLLVTAFLAGSCVSGGQMSVITLATVLYPPHLRALGVGWGMGIGRLGGAAGPVLAGIALGAGVPATMVFIALAVVMLTAAASVFFIHRGERRSACGTYPRLDADERSKACASTGNSLEFDR